MQLTPIDKVHWSVKKEKISHSKFYQFKQLAHKCDMPHMSLRMTSISTQLTKNITFFTCDDKLIISFRNQGTQVRDNIDRTAKNAINTTNLANGLSEWCLEIYFLKLDVQNILKKSKAGAITSFKKTQCVRKKKIELTI